MKYVNGLYVSLALMMFIILIDSTIFDNKYSGIFTFMCLGVFIIGTAFYVSAKQFNKQQKKE